jgi:quercetin dioxygenase-like cupin family protein
VPIIRCRRSSPRQRSSALRISQPQPAFACHIQSGMSVKHIVRKQLLSVPFENQNVTSVEVREINFEPGQETGRHVHPCPVLGYIVEGSAVVQVEGQAEQRLAAGDAFYEPAEAVMRFDNASSNHPLKFICYYLLDGKQDLIRMLPAA